MGGTCSLSLPSSPDGERPCRPEAALGAVSIRGPLSFFYGPSVRSTAHALTNREVRMVCLRWTRNKSRFGDPGGQGRDLLASRKFRNESRSFFAAVWGDEFFSTRRLCWGCADSQISFFLVARICTPGKKARKQRFSLYSGGAVDRFFFFFISGEPPFSLPFFCPGQKSPPCFT